MEGLNQTFVYGTAFLVGWILYSIYSAIRSTKQLRAQSKDLDRQIHNEFTEINNLLKQIQETVPVPPAEEVVMVTPEPPPSSPKPPPIPDRGPTPPTIAETILNEWKLALASGLDKFTPSSTHRVGKSRCVSGSYIRRKDMPVVEAKASFSGFGASPLPALKIAYANEVLLQCAEEIEEEEKPIIFPVFASPASQVMLPEPPAVQALLKSYRRTRGRILV